MRDFALARYFSRWVCSARYQLAASECEAPTLTDLLDHAEAEARGRWDALALGYPDPRGATALRHAIAAGYVEVDADAVLCCAGAQEGLYLAMTALLRADDHAIVVTPNYQSIETIPLGICAVTGVALDHSDDWSLDIDAIAAAIRPCTRLVSINFPNNPTGKILEHDRFAALIAVCRRHGLWLFSDEVYRLIERNPETRLPPAVDAYELGISLGSMSKSFGLPGLRIGWLACRDRAALGRMEQIKHYLSSCNAGPSELLAEIALKAGERILARNRAIVADNLIQLTAFFDDCADLFEWQVPDGGVVAFPRYHGPEGAERFCTNLIEGDGVLLLPGSLYGSELTEIPTDRFRIGFGRSDLVHGLAAIQAHLQRRPVRRPLRPAPSLQVARS
jgi:aspartate/methionine/tyrosine aminotransferase